MLLKLPHYSDIICKKSQVYRLSSLNAKKCVRLHRLEHLQQCLKLVPQIEIWDSTQEKLLQQCPIS
jgi:hypothetical protein